MIASFGFNHFTGVWVFVNFQLARLASADRLSRRLAARAALLVQQIYDVFQVETVLIQQPAQFGLELNFFLQSTVALGKGDRFIIG